MFREEWNLSLQVSFNFFKIKPVSSMWFETSKLRNKTNIYRHRKDPPFKRSSLMSDKVSQEGPRHGQCTVLAQLLSNSSHSRLSFLSWHFPVSRYYVILLYYSRRTILWLRFLMFECSRCISSSKQVKVVHKAPGHFPIFMWFFISIWVSGHTHFFKHWSSILCITVIVLNYLCDWCQWIQNSDDILGSVNQLSN